MLNYSLHLQDGNCWQFGAQNGAEEWLATIAAIMRLEPADGVKFPRILFYQSGTANFEFTHVRTRLNYLARNSTWFVDHPDSFAVWCRDIVTDVVCRLVLNSSVAGIDLQTMMFFDLPIFMKSIFLGGIPVHGALIRKGNKGYILIGKSGAGKTTCCRRLPGNWMAMADDEILVVKTPDGRYYAHPFPTWSDYYLNRNLRPTWDVQQAVPVSALFFLQQDKTDSVHVLPAQNAVIYITDSVMEICHKFWHRADKLLQRRMRCMVLDNVCALCRGIPAFTLQTTITGEFWREIESVV
ncbi:SynChlorMet cassette protein ScmC [candidate division KSB1 bacterium]|nr:SynChlorMet cassette protein ScmC [candidate division KSB1 bacterium]